MIGVGITTKQVSKVPIDERLVQSWPGQFQDGLGVAIVAARLEVGHSVRDETLRQGRALRAE